jgi:hypothetical protein
MDLSQLAIGGNAAIQAQRDIEDRNYLTKQRELGTARINAGLETLPDEMAAEKSRLALTRAQSDAGLDTLPAESRVKKLNTQIAEEKAQFGLDQLPTEQKTQRVKNDMGLTTAEAESKLLPQKIFSELTQGTITQDQARDRVFGTFAQKIMDNDKEGLLQFANQVAAIPGFFPNTDGKKFVDIQPVGSNENGVDTRAYRMVTSDGTYKDVPASQLASAFQRQKASELKTLKPGEILVGVKGGKASALFTAPESLKGANQHTPAEVQTAEWLIKNGVAKDPNAAWSMVRSARGKTKAAFVADLVKGSIMPGTKSADLVEMEKTFGDMYDRLHSDSPGLPAPASNTPSVPTIDPKVKELIGIP